MFSGTINRTWNTQLTILRIYTAQLTVLANSLDWFGAGIGLFTARYNREYLRGWYIQLLRVTHWDLSTINSFLAHYDDENYDHIMIQIANDYDGGYCDHLYHLDAFLKEIIPFIYFCLH